LLQVNSNGLLSFGASIHNEYTPRPLPISRLTTPFIAPYWADVDTTANNGRIYYRNVTGKYCEYASKNKSSAVAEKRRYAFVRLFIICSTVMVQISS